MEKKEMSPIYKSAKMKTLQDLKDSMVEMMKGDLQKPGLKKVSVAVNDEDSNSGQLGQDEEYEHVVDAGQHDMFDVSPEMEEEAEEGDSMEPEHEGEMHSNLSDEEEKLLQLLLKKKG